MQKARGNSDTFENLIENKGKAAVKCMPPGVSRDFVSAIVRNKRIPHSVLEEVTKKISFMCKNNFIFADNTSISNIHLSDDGLHLVKSCGCILGDNVIERLNTPTPPKSH